MIIEELVALLGFKLEGKDDVARFRNALTGVRDKLTTVVAVAKGVAVGALAGVAGGMIAAGKGAISTGMQFENLGLVLETIEGSSEKAKASLDWVAKFAAKTPYDLAGVSEAFVQLRAYGMDATAMRPALGDAAAAMNKPLMQAVEAIADAARGEMERLKEFGITADKAGGNAVLSWDQDGKTLTKTVKKNSQELQKAVVDIFGARFHGAMDRLSFGLSGMFSNIGDMWTRFQQMINDAGWYQWIKVQTKELLDWFNALDEDGTLRDWARSLSRALVSVGDALKHTGLMVWAFVKRFGDLPDSVKAGAAALGGLLFALAFPMVTALGALVLILDDVWGYLNGWDSVTGDIVSWFKETLGLSEGVSEALVGVGAAFATVAAGLAVIAPLGTVTALFKGLLWAVGGIIGAVGIVPVAIAAAVAGAFAAIYVFRDEIIAWLDDMSERFPALSGLFGLLKEAALTVVAPIQKALEGDIGGAFLGLLDMATFSIGKIKDAFVAFFAWVAGGFAPIWESAAPEWLKGSAGWVGSTVGDAVGGAFRSAKSWATDNADWLAGLASVAGNPHSDRVLSPGPLLPPGQATVSNTTTATVNAPVSVTMSGTNASPQAVGEATSEALSRRLAATLPAAVGGR